MAQVYQTPGVYIEEKNAFPNSVVAVATAVPAFIGYTAMAMRGKKTLHMKPTRITSLADYISFFGGAPNNTYNLVGPEGTPATADAFQFEKESIFHLYNSIRLFFANGGGPCYIISVGEYMEKDGEEAKPAKIEKDKLIEGLKPLLKEQEPTIIVVPDATLLEDENQCYDVYKEVLNHCGYKMKNRVGIFDVFNGFQDRTHDEEDVITKFRSGIGTNFLAFGGAYYPWLNTSIVQGNELDYNNINNLDDLKALLMAEFPTIEGLDPAEPEAQRTAQIQELIQKIGTDLNATDTLALSNTLKAVSPLFKEIISELTKVMNVLPPSSAMAGIYTMVDNTIGVHKAPANVSLNGVIGPSVNLTAENQQNLNLPLDGKAINAIRTFIGKGVLVWGARTLDGNSNDWRYINVRRTLIMIEESIRIAAGAYVFEPNDANTWINMKGMLDSFLANQWRTGALVGPSPAEAFSVDVGLGVTMTPQDVLEGIMRISVKLAISRPAEFIVITFQQQMQKG